ncbi:hypothetical protein DFH07DRAFT_1014606 [Mycena maculata]|uniref:F-box domain-containing protein n=1 Tax=Mycena maculata TaxID=230809 RepID=A0AAD7HA85_9AGAR|nr:hypothetical protein DFH07DRAFT_1014606 [Mycena maculata]
MDLYHLAAPPIHLSSTNNVPSILLVLALYATDAPPTPSDAEALELRRAIHKGHAHLEPLASQMKLLQSAPDALHQEWNRLRDTIDQYRAILSPLRGFAPEIMHEIFSWTLGLPTADNITIPPRNTQSPWNVSRVCSRWWAISISDPALWSTISIDSRTLALFALDAHLQRSNPRFLTITFQFYDVTLFRLLAEHSRRLQSVRFDALTTPFIQVLDGISGCLPELRRLELTYPRMGSPCRAFEAAPKLSEVIALDCNRNAGYPLSLPCKQLRRLRIGLLYAPHPFLAPNLLELTLCNIREMPDHPIHFPRLRMLHVIDGTFLPSLVLPALEELFIDKNPLLALAMIRQSGCSLQKLGLVHCSAEHCASILEDTPTIDDLWLEMSSGPFSRMTVRMAPDPDTLVLAPALRTIHIFRTEYHALHDVLPILVELLQSRHRSVDYPTPSLCVLDFTNGKKTSTICRMEANLGRQGIDVEWLTRKHSRDKYEEYKSRYP